MSQQIEVNIKAVDNASKTIVQASQKVNSSLKTIEEANKRVADSNKQVSSSSREIVSSLSDSERQQLSTVEAAQRLEVSEQRVRETKRALSVAVRDHGAASEEATRALREYNDAQQNASVLSDQLGGKIRQTTRSTKELVVGFSGVATSAFSLYSAYDQIQNAQIGLDNANLQIKSSLGSC